jgi:hypothetical protein
MLMEINLLKFETLGVQGFGREIGLLSPGNGLVL